MRWANRKTLSYSLTPEGVGMHDGTQEILICDAIDVHSRICIDVPMAIPQHWITLTFSDAEGQEKQVILLDCMLQENRFWSLLGDLYQEDFRVRAGFEQSVRDYLLHRARIIHEFRLSETTPSQAVYLSDDRPGWGALYDNFKRVSGSDLQP
jgi:hypothetical protein